MLAKRPPIDPISIGNDDPKSVLEEQDLSFVGGRLETRGRIVRRTDVGVRNSN